MTFAFSHSKFWLIGKVHSMPKNSLDPGKDDVPLGHPAWLGVSTVVQWLEKNVDLCTLRQDLTEIWFIF